MGDTIDIRWRFSHPQPKSKTAFKRSPVEQQVIALTYQAINEALGRMDSEADAS